jgi:hypothetical protein
VSLGTRSRERPGYLDSLDDAVDLCFAFNLRPASQRPDRASPEEDMLETHLTFDVVCQATVHLLRALTGLVAACLARVLLDVPMTWLRKAGMS